MKITFRLVVCLIGVLLLVAVGFSLWQARKEETRLNAELEKRAHLIADGLEDSVKFILSDQSILSLKPVVDKFSNREKVIGVTIHDIQGNKIVASSAIQQNPEIYEDALQDYVKSIDKNENNYSSFLSFGRIRAHVYSLIVSYAGNPSYVLTVVHDQSYVRDRVFRIWRNSFWRSLIQIFLVALTTFIIIYMNVTKPMIRAADWIRKIRTGEPSEESDLKPEIKELLGPIASEVSKMAKSLEMARLTAEEEARLRHATESVWTRERLKEKMREVLNDRPLFVVSNREPYVHERKGKEIECTVPASGLVTAIEPILKACGGTWIAQATGSADREVSDSSGKIRVPPESPQYLLRRIWLTPEEENGFYYGFSNEGLWPLCHIAHTRPLFRPDDWIDYVKVNEKFCDVLVEELANIQEPCILIQDYHFALLPRMVKEKRPDARVSIFWHIPWPNAESFGICPWRKELLQGMLGADIIGFHTQYHCNNFIESVDRFLESRIDYESFSVNRENHTTYIRPYPISIEFVDSCSPAPAPSIAETISISKMEIAKRYGIESEILAVGVDRLDYTKGIVERLRSIEHFLANNPSYIGRFTYVELGAPSRSLIPRYADFVAEVERVVESINSKFKTPSGRPPIVFLKKNHSHREILPFYQSADICMVTSLHDGMNLVAKEFVASRADEQGVLILSQFTGAARELVDALIVNPYDITQTAFAIKSALEMPEGERREKMRRMRNVIREKNIYKWGADLVSELAQVRAVPSL